MSDDWATPVGDVAKKLFMVLFGPPNVGKTVLANRVSGKVLILTDESGHRALNDFPELQEKAKVRVFKTTQDIYTAMDRRRKGLEDFDTLLIDTFTGIQSKVLQQYMDPKFPGYLDVERRHPKVPVLQDYLLSEKIWNPILQDLAAQSDFNVILNCHVRFPDTEKKVPGDKVRPKLPDAIYQVANGKANLVIYMDTIGGDEKPSNKPVGLGERTPIQRFVSTVATNKVAGKSQIKSLRPLMSDDDFVKAVTEWLQSR